MGVDERMDRALRAVEKKLGRPVSYVPKGSTTAIDTTADFQESAQQFGDQPGVSTPHGVLDFRAATLEDAGITPTPGDVVTFAVRDVSRTLEVVEVTHPAPGSVVLVLGRAS